jgi:uncharacterized protein
MTDVVVRGLRQEWPAAGLDVTGLRARGVAPTPLRQVILKVAARCDLACTYCYVYSLADTTWRDRPRIMDAQTVRATGRRIREHALAHGLDEVRVVFHGGEPLLAGAAWLRTACRTLRETVGDATRLRFSLQTNAVRLDETVLEMAAAEGIRIGVSLDGDRETNDRARRHRSGAGTFDSVDRALRLLNEPRYRPLLSGILAVIDVEADPVRAYTALAAYRPPALDFLLPFANWDSPPRRPAGDGNADAAGAGVDIGAGAASPTPYGDWLSAVFDHWFGLAEPGPSIRILAEALQLIIGGDGGTEVMGLAPVVSVVVETDGAIEQTGGLRAAYDGASGTGRSVHDGGSFDDLLDTPQFAARQGGLDVLSPECRACDVVSVCGGGHYAHRWSADRGFLNRSVYCDDLKVLIERMTGRVAAELAAPAPEPVSEPARAPERAPKGVPPAPAAEETGRTPAHHPRSERAR